MQKPEAGYAAGFGGKLFEAVDCGQDACDYVGFFGHRRGGIGGRSGHWVGGCHLDVVLGS